MMSSEALLNCQNGKFHFIVHSRLFKNFYLYIFGCAGSSLLHRRSLVAESGGCSSFCAQGSSGFFCWGAQALGHAGFSSCSSPAPEHRLNKGLRA